MSKCTRLAALGLMTFLGIAAGAPAAEQRAGAAGPAPAAGPAVSTVPPFSFLAGEPMQNELKLSDEQKQKLNQLIAEFQSGMQKQAQANEATLRSLPVEERQARYQEMQAAGNRRIQAFGQELEAALTPQQLQHLQQLAFLLNAGPSLGNPQLLQQLGADQQQQQKIQQIHQAAQNKLVQIQREMQAQMFQAQREMAEKSVEVLTPEQRKLLQQMTSPPAPAKSKQPE